jgi:peptide/nickel transport system ATP-binding protein
MNDAVKTSGELLRVTGLRKDFDIVKGIGRRKVGTIRAVDDVSFTVNKGEILGLVGESGCGKTTTGRCIMRAVEPTAGKVELTLGESGPVDVLGLGPEEYKQVLRHIRMIFQDPFSSLNPRMNVMEIVAEALLSHGLVSSRMETEERVAAMLEKVGLDPRTMRRYPHAFSGGQRQRIAIARALVVGPKFVVADEPVSALDVSVQAQILNLLQGLQRELDLTYLFVAHNLAVVQHISDRVAVMYMGRLVELADTGELYSRPRHPYTEALLSAVPMPDPKAKSRKKRVILTGEVADLAHPPSGCPFHPRCSYVTDVCRSERPALAAMNAQGRSEHLAACHRVAELELAGVAD